MRKQFYFVKLIFIFIILLIFQGCKTRPIMPENIDILKGYDYSKIKKSMDTEDFINYKKIEKEFFSKIVKKEFSSYGFLFKKENAEFTLEGNLIKFKESKSSDFIYTDVNGVSIPIEDETLSYEISFVLSVKDNKTGKKIWSCKVSEEKETDYPKALIEKMINACIKTMVENK